MTKSSISIISLIFILFLAGGYIFISNSENNIEVTSDSENPSQDSILLRYTEGGGSDMYFDGDRYGYAIEISKSGDYRFYRRVFEEKEGGSEIVDKLLNEGRIDEATFASLKMTFEEADFFTLPQRLPAGSLHQIEIRTPAANVSISFRRVPEEEFYTVRANLGADRQHYPEAFFELRSELREIIQGIRETHN